MSTDGPLDRLLPAPDRRHLRCGWGWGGGWGRKRQWFLFSSLLWLSLMGPAKGHQQKGTHVGRITTPALTEGDPTDTALSES